MAELPADEGVENSEGTAPGATESATTEAAATELAATNASPHAGVECNLAELPTYARGLLRIRVPVQVTLAAQRKSIQEITELGPGSIIRFDKTCDQPLELSVGDRPLAQGEVVKVGDKFGLRISGLITY